MSQKLLTTDQVAEELTVTSEQVRRLVLDDELHPINVARRGAKRQRLRFEDEDIRAFKERRKRRSQCPASERRDRRRSVAADR